MFYTLNRIEEDTFAVMVDDNGKKTDIPLSELQEDFRIGNVYELSDGVYIYNEKETEKRRNSASERLKRLFNKN